MPGLDEDVLRHALSTARKHGFRRVKLRSQGERFSALLGEAPSIDDESESVENDFDSVTEDIGPRDVLITAPVVGYFQDGQAPLEPGRKVGSGETIGEIVALGITNDVVSLEEGEVIEVLVGSGEPVEYGQVLAKVRTV